MFSIIQKNQNKESGWVFQNGHLFLSKIGFSQKKSCKKRPDFHFCLIMLRIPIFSLKNGAA